MKSSNKLDYLSKYLGEDKKKKEKKSKKEKRSKNSRKDENTRIQDSDQVDDIFALAADHADDPEHEDSADEGPIVVESSTEVILSLPKGQWEPVGGDVNYENDVSSEKKTRNRDDDAMIRHQTKKIQEYQVRKKPATSRAIKTKDDDSSLDENANDVKNRRRYDSSSSDEGKRTSQRRRHDSSSSDDSRDDDRERTSSGHVAGLQTGSKFSKTEKKLNDEKEEGARTMVEKYGHGDTVYREKTTGRKVQKIQTNDEEALRTKVLLNTSQVQRERELQRQQEALAIQHASFARHADDERLEAMRKSEIREGDPMAAFGAKKKATRKTNETSNDEFAKPSNRFGIRPGFRWDGVDRGNGFEDKLLSQRNQVQHQKEVAYRWSTADM